MIRSSLSKSSSSSPAPFSSIQSLTASFVFRGCEYTLELSSPPAGDTGIPLQLTLTSADAGTGDVSETGRWVGSFTPAEVEQMTSKTGAFQTFAEMVSIIATLIRSRQNGSAATENTITYAHKNPNFNTVAIDVLTYADLEVLKHRRAGGGSAPPPQPSDRETPRAAGRRKLNKRYVIITIGSNRNEDEKIHYPLPLPFAKPTQPTPVAKMQTTLGNDVNALKAQIARLTQSMTSKPSSASPPPSYGNVTHTPSTTTKRLPSQSQLYHSSSAVELRSYRSESRSRTPSPTSSRHHHPRNDSFSPSRHAHEVQRQDDLSSIAHLTRSTRHTSSRRRPHHIKGDHSEPEDSLDDSRHIDEPPDLPPSALQYCRRLETQLLAAQEALEFEKQVSTARIKTLEAENRSLRRREQEAVAKLTQSQKSLSLITLESERLKSKVEEFMMSTRREASSGRTPVQTNGRARSRTPTMTTSQIRIGSVSPSQVRMLARAQVGGGSATNSRSNSPYLQRGTGGGGGGGSGRQTPTRGVSPSASGRGTPTRSMSVSARAPSSRGTSPLTSPANRGVTSDRVPRVPIDLDYRHWPTSRSDSRSPLRRFNPTDYVAMKRESLARKALEMADRNRAEIRQITRPSSHLTTSIIPTRNLRAGSRSPSRSIDGRTSPSLTPTRSSSQQFSNSYRGRRTPPPVFSFDHSTGREPGHAIRQPSGYVEGPNDRARSRRFPHDTTSNGRHLRESQRDLIEAELIRSNSMSQMHDDDDFGGIRRSTSHVDVDVDDDGDPFSDRISSSTGGASLRHARTPLIDLERTEFEDLNDLARSSRTPRTARSQQSSGSLLTSEDMKVLTFTDEERAEFQPPSRPTHRESQLEPLIPTLSSEDMELNDTPRDQEPENVDNVQALTNRLAKLQQYLAAEKAS